MEYVKSYSIGLGIEQALIRLRDKGIIQNRENQDRFDTTKEIGLCLDVETPNNEPFISRCIVTDLKGLAKYDHEFLDGTSDNLGWKYTYHSLYEPYYQKVIDEFKRNPGTRRACIALGQGDINFTEDPPCLQLIMFNLVNDKLEMTTVMRSNDAVKAFPMNIHAFEMLHEKIASELGYKVGTLHYIANNFHCYSKDLKTLEAYCQTFETAKAARRFANREDLMKVL